MRSEDRYVGDGEYWDTHEDYHLPDAEFKVQAIWPLLAGVEVWRPGDEDGGLRVSDVGCGAGGVLALLVERLEARHKIEKACGYDVSERAITVAQDRFPSIEFRRGSSEECDQGWDLLVSCDVFEHVENPFAFLRELTGKSRFYAFHIPMDLCAETLLRQQRLAIAFHDGGHIHHYCKTTALETLRFAGFRILQSRYADKWHHRKNSRRLSLKTRLLRWPERLLACTWPDLKVALFGGASLAVLATDAERAVD